MTNKSLLYVCLCFAMFQSVPGWAQTQDDQLASLSALSKTTVPTRVEYAVSVEQPTASSSNWKPSDGKSINDIQPFARYWIRAEQSALGTYAPRWVVYGPLEGSNDEIEVIRVESNGKPEAIQFQTKAATSAKGWGCCKVTLRIRIVTKVPDITVKPPTLPQITIDWKKPLPSVTVRGPNIIVDDLPRLPQLESSVPVDGTPSLGMQCEIVDGNAHVSLQNGESVDVDAWIVWKGTYLGPIRIQGNTMRSLGNTAYSDCKVAEDNIYVTRVAFAK